LRTDRLFRLDGGRHHELALAARMLDHHHGVGAGGHGGAGHDLDGLAAGDLPGERAARAGFANHAQPAGGVSGA